VPTKTGEKVRIIVLGTGPDAELAKAVAQSDADVALAAKFTKTVTHLVIDDTVKPAEARLKKAEEAGVPVLTVAEFRDLLTAGEEDEVDHHAGDADEPTAATATAADAETADEPADEVEPVEVEAEVAAEPEPVVPAQAEAPAAESAADESDAEPAAEAVSEPEETAAEASDTAVEAAESDTAESDTAEPATAETETAAEEPAEKTEAADVSVPSPRPGFVARLKSIFGLTGAKK
jgi:hypothetical protein